jgi:hypothetical protein
MQYTLTSHGRPLGVTDLGFARHDARIRSGWFHPNALGERVMPVIAAVLPAFWREVEPGESGSTGGAGATQTVEFTDPEESVQHVETLVLEIHADDGSIVPSDLLGLEDSLRPRRMGGIQAGSGSSGTPVSYPARAQGQGELDTSRVSRYQIHVRLTEDNAIP